MKSTAETFVALTYDTDAPSCEYATLELPWWVGGVYADAPWLLMVSRGLVREGRAAKRVFRRCTRRPTSSFSDAARSRIFSHPP